MKVSPNAAAGVYKNTVIEQKKGNVAKSERSPKNVDSIKISAASAERTTAQLIESLKAQILQDVKAGIDSHQLSELKREVASGSYEINPAEIVHKIMGD